MLFPDTSATCLTMSLQSISISSTVCGEVRLSVVQCSALPSKVVILWLKGQRLSEKRLLFLLTVKERKYGDHTTLIVARSDRPTSPVVFRLHELLKNPVERRAALEQELFCGQLRVPRFFSPRYSTDIICSLSSV